MHPGVDTYCFFSSGLPTSGKLEFAEGAFPDGQPRRTFDDGDGSVHRDSLSACAKWRHSDEAGHRLYVHEVRRTSHNKIMSHVDVLKMLEHISASDEFGNADSLGK